MFKRKLSEYNLKADPLFNIAAKQEIESEQKDG